MAPERSIRHRPTRSTWTPPERVPAILERIAGRGEPGIPGLPDSFLSIFALGNEGQVTDTEADEMEEHLRGLGYIE